MGLPVFGFRARTFDHEHTTLYNQTHYKSMNIGMEVLLNLPQPIKNAQKSLEPYIKQRNEAAQIRRVLASHLNSYVNQDDEHSPARPLSLLTAASNVDTPEHGIKGLHKEYLRCARANVQARNEFASLSKGHRQANEDEGFGARTTASQNVSSSSMDSFLDVVKKRQKHERLRIVQDYIDALCQKPSSTPEHLDPRIVLKDVETLPKVPPEVLNPPTISQSLGGADLNGLVDQLDKSVLRAKMLLKNEQKLLEKVRTRNGLPSESYGGQLQALGSARNELISWIEAELARAGDSSSTVDDYEMAVTGSRGKEYIDTQLASIHRQYGRYAKSRQKLILAATGRLEIPPVTVEGDEDVSTTIKEPYVSSGVQVVFPYLEQMVSISNDQKAMIQQKSHLSISLAKQLKETNQGLDRLAEESHLLPSHPMPAVPSIQKHAEVPVSFGDEMSNHEKPDSSRRAQAWVFAAESAGKATEQSVFATLDEGGSALENAHQTLDDLQRLLGNVIDSTPKAGGDIWAVLDGSLGVIKADEVD